MSETKTKTTKRKIIEASINPGCKEVMVVTLDWKILHPIISSLRSDTTWLAIHCEPDKLRMEGMDVSHVTLSVCTITPYTCRYYSCTSNGFISVSVRDIYDALKTIKPTKKQQQGIYPITLQLLKSDIPDRYLMYLYDGTPHEFKCLYEITVSDEMPEHLGIPDHHSLYYTISSDDLKNTLSGLKCSSVSIGVDMDKIIVSNGDNNSGVVQHIPISNKNMDDQGKHSYLYSYPIIKTKAPLYTLNEEMDIRCSSNEFPLELKWVLGDYRQEIKAIIRKHLPSNCCPKPIVDIILAQFFEKHTESCFRFFIASKVEDPS